MLSILRQNNMNNAKVSSIQLGIESYDVEEDTEDELIAVECPAERGVTIQTAKIGSLEAEGDRAHSKVAFDETKKKLLAKQEAERHLAAPKTARTRSWMLEKPLSYIRNVSSKKKQDVVEEEQDVVMDDESIRAVVLPSRDPVGRVWNWEVGIWNSRIPNSKFLIPNS